MSLRLTTAGAVLNIDEPSLVAEARRIAIDMGRRLRLDDDRLGRLGILVTEATSNQLRHAGGGRLSLSSQRDGDDAWVEVLAIDSGPGIRRLGAALSGGYSDRGGLGQGLSAIRRLADHFAIFAPPGRGTAVLARVGAQPKVERTSPLAGLCRAKVDNAPRGAGPPLSKAPCGDGWAARHLSPERTLLLVLDGVGHGQRAHEVTQRGLGALNEAGHTNPCTLLAEAHRAIAGSHGAAALALLFDTRERTLRYAGVGNVSATLITDPENRRGLITLNGTLGVGTPSLREFNVPWTPGATVVTQTDGVSSRWQLSDHPGLWRQEPALMAGVLFRDHAWPHDDATVVVTRHMPQQPSP